jgi:hypothetical protein
MMIGAAVFMAILFFWPAAAIVGLIGLSPTLVYWFVDSHAYRGLRIKTIFFFNLAGVVPYVFKTIETSGFQGVGAVLSDSVAIFTMLGAGALGVMVLGVAPNFAAVFMQMSANERVRKIEAQQKVLLDIWGDDIISQGTNEN